MYEVIAFYLFATLVVSLFLITVFSKNALYAMSSLAGGMIFIAGFFFLLDAEFLGVVQIIVYAGSIMAIYAFGMMFFDTTKDLKEKIKFKKTIYTLGILAAVLTVFMVSAPILLKQEEIITKQNQFISLKELSQSVPSLKIETDISNTHAIGRVLFTKYLVVFELTAVMLLVAMIAGIVLVSKRMDEEQDEVKT